MKRFLLAILLLSLTTSFSSGLFAQDTTRTTPYHQQTNNYVVLTKKIPQLKPILLTAEAFKQEDGDTFGDFRIVICGQGIVDITDRAQIDPFIAQAKEFGVKLVACGFSLDKFKVARTDVPADIEIVDNGIQYNFTLQKAGYYSLSL
ncbi:intracellular sulfur oxidation DsrE/DsrF family protein [Lewinella aquimaris]|uniref:Intracellular sulfur oxidation DsrE/DsrF family protein n=1 Tax=Neolewinella aquimaris TaxID=1835722 RepID=A0A840EE19_9BACT|nr:sulfur reduction protein DsrE [Neolewinella aquimaris]MBB4079186.1 intracellular sulfur oxidation DsrE/DsrF family protein [Neolewinella aquimaris]